MVIVKDAVVLVYIIFPSRRCAYLSTVDDGLETRSTQSVHSECRHWDGDATPQTHMTGNVGRIS